MVNQLNKKCECGSGRKARYCCFKEQATSQKTEHLKTVIIPSARRNVVKQLKELMIERVEREEVINAWQYFSDEKNEEIPEQMLPIFMPWFIYRWDSFAHIGETQWYLDGSGSVAEKLLKQARSKLTTYEAECLREGIKTPLSFFKILDADPGSAATFIDLLRGDQVELTVKDKGLSLSARAGSIFFGLVFRGDDVVTCEGVAPLMISPSFTAEIDDFRAKLKKKFGVINGELLLQSEAEILDLYWSIDEALRRPPIITNTSGEVIKIQTLYFDCSDQHQAIKCLAPMARDPRLVSELIEKSKTEEIDEIVKFEWLSAKPSKKLNGPVIYGHIEISRNRIKVQVNSNERARRCVNELNKRLGDFAKFKTTVYESLEQHRKSESLKPVPHQVLPPEAMEALIMHAEERKKKWFDLPIPMLGGKSPRQAAKTPEGRAQLENLIEVYNFNRAPGSKDQLELTHLMNPTEEEIRRELGL